MTIIRTERRFFENTILAPGQLAQDIITLELYEGDGATTGGVLQTAEGTGGGLVTFACATTGNISNLATELAVGQTIDGYVIQTGDLILVKDQSTASENGVYATTGLRSSDFQLSSDWTDGDLFFINNGTANSGSFFEAVVPTPFVIDTNNLTFQAPAVKQELDAYKTLLSGSTGAENIGFNPSTVADFETSLGSVSLMKAALDQVAALRADTIKEAVSDDVYTELRTRLVRDSETGELFVVVGDGATSTKYRIDAKLDARTAKIPGATPNQPIHPFLSSPNGHVLELVTDSNGNLRAYFIPGDGSTKREIAQGISGAVDVAETYDIEYTDVDNVIGLGATEKYSLITGSSDSKGANGLPIIQNFQLPDAGANPYPLVINGGGDVAPLGKILNKSENIVRHYTGAIDSFLSVAQQGEICLCKTASSIVGVTAPVDKFYGCVKTSGRIIDGSDKTTTITGSADNAGDIQFTCSGAADLTVNVNVDDIIFVSGADGDSAELGQHKVKAVTGTTITVETNWHAGSASTAGTIRLEALVEALTSTTI